MNRTVSQNWIELTADQFSSLLKNTDWQRDGWGNGIFYEHRHSKQCFAAELDDGRLLADPDAGDMKTA